jgi:4-amino-4-deoxy-L-arabinose transferase-like glycosyltransferase
MYAYFIISILNPENWFAWGAGVYNIVGRYPFTVLLGFLYLAAYAPKLNLHRAIITWEFCSLIILLTALMYPSQVSSIIQGLGVQHRGVNILEKHLLRIASVIVVFPLMLMAFIHWKPTLRYHVMHRPYITWLFWGVCMFSIFPKFHTYYFLSVIPPISILSAAAFHTVRNPLKNLLAALYLVSWVLALSYPYTATLELSTARAVSDYLGEGEVLGNPIYAYLSENRLALDLSHPMPYMHSGGSVHELTSYMESKPPERVPIDAYFRVAYGTLIEDSGAYCHAADINNVEIWRLC